MSQVSSNKKILKNTLYLYTRQIVVIIVSLYTSRVVLSTLGFSDYGLYNVVGGIVVMFSFLNGAMRSSTQRFLNFELGSKDIEKAKDVFCVSMMSFVVIMIIIVLLAETIGLWFLNTHLNIPPNRLYAANWVYQLSIFAFCISILQVPYNATIVAYEKMEFYAYISIIEVLLKLAIVFLLDLFGSDKLITYSILYSVVSFTVLLIYGGYCNRTFDITRFRIVKKTALFKEILGFSSWSVFGSIARICSNQGISIVLNLFCGVLLNAASGVAHQVSSKIYGFVGNFQVAFNPQITKRYAAKEYDSMFELIYISSKISFFLFYVMAVPLIYNCDFILKLWLGDVPEFAVEFTSLSIIFLLVDCLQAPLWMTIQATGEIKRYQIVVSSMILLNLPLIYFCLYIGMSPLSVWIVRIVIDLLLYGVRLYFTKIYTQMDLLKYIRSVLFPVGLTIFLSISLILMIRLPNNSFVEFIASSIIYFISTGLIVLLFGLNRREKSVVYKRILKR